MIVKKKNFTRFVELGCWKGHSIRYLALQLNKRGGLFEIYGVDLWEVEFHHEYDPDSCDDNPNTLYNMYCTNLMNAGVRDLITDIRMCSWEAANQFEDNSVDFVFIDADHTYESVSKDIKAWLPKIRYGGIISGHDYGIPDIHKAIDEVFAKSALSLLSKYVWCVNIGVDGFTSKNETV